MRHTTISALLLGLISTYVDTLAAQPEHQNTTTVELTTVTSVADLFGELISVFPPQEEEHVKLEPRIIGGTEAVEDEFPFLVYLLPCKKKKAGSSSRECFLCGGAIIQRNWIMTAGHCVAPLSEYEYVRAYFGRHGSGDSDSNIKIYPKDFRLHKKYESSGGPLLNDIALIKIPDGKHKLTKFPSLSTMPPTANSKITIAGWGVVNTETKATASALRKVDLPVLSDNTCKSWLGRNFIATTTWCAGHKQGGKDSCQGDSGGPSFVKEPNGDFTIYGVVSYGIGCAQKYSPGVYTSIAEYRSWVTGVMAGTMEAQNLEDAGSNAGSGDSLICTFLEILFGAECAAADLKTSWTLAGSMVLFFLYMV